MAVEIMSRLEFSTATKRAASKRANGRCETCGLPFKGHPQYDHRLPCALGGTNDPANCVALCIPCHTEKTAKEDVPRIRKADRQTNAHAGARRPKQPMKSGAKLRGPERTHEGRRELPRRSMYEDVK